MMRSSSLLLAALCGLLAATCGATAHAVVFDSTPESGARLTAMPSEVEVTFTEPVYEEGSWIRVLDGDGERVDDDDLHVTFGPQPVMRIGLLPALPDGAYRILWQTYSESDGHTVAGVIGFAVGNAEPPASVDAPSAAATLGSVIGRTLTYIGYAAAGGVLLWRTWMGRPSGPGMDRALVGAGISHFVGTGLLLTETAAGTGLPAAVFLQGDGGSALLQRWLLSAGVVFITLLWTYGPRPRYALFVFAVGWLANAWLGAQVGHAAGLGAWALIAQFVHVVAMATWVGGLGMLALTWRGEQDPERTLEVGRRFSTWALWAVGAIGLTGLLLTVGILGPGTMNAATWTTPGWGPVLLAKVGLVVVMIGLAGLNRFRYMGHADRDRSLQRAVAAEAGVGAVVLLLAGLLMSMGAPQGLSGSGGEGGPDAVWVADAVGDEHVVRFEVRPTPEAGAFSTVRIFVEQVGASVEQDTPVEDNTCGRDDCLRLRWWPVGDGEDAADRRTGIPEGGGWWRFDDVLFPTDGEHVLALEIQTDQVYRDEPTATVPVVAADDAASSE